MSVNLSTRIADLRIKREALSDLQARHPLDFYTHASWASEWIAENLDKGWFYWHAANSGGKSQSLACMGVAFLKGYDALGVERRGTFWNGKPWHARRIPIPKIAPPVVGAIGTPSYKLGAAGSIIDKVREAIGKWPHHEERIAGSVSVFHVMHQDRPSDNWHDFSKLYVFPYEGPTPEGPRLDFWLADEPPPPLWLSAILNRGKQGRNLYGGIGATPVMMKSWGPIKKQFPEAHCVWVEGRARVQSSVYDNRFMTARDIMRQERANPKSIKLSRAKLYGEHVNAEGTCPFDVNTLDEMLKECRQPEIIEWKVPRETLAGVISSARDVKFDRVDVEVFKESEKNERYFIAIDPSSGTDDKAHDPAGLLVVKMGTCELVARWNGYLAPYSVGILAAALARVGYNNAMIDVEVNDRWGVSVIKAIGDSGYGGLCYEERELSPGRFAPEVGFQNNAQSRPVIIGEVQGWIDSWRNGVRYAPCPSRHVIETLMSCQLVAGKDGRSKIVGLPGVHDEDLILWGQCLRRALLMPYRGVVRKPEEPIWTNEDQAKANNKALTRLIRGEDEESELPGEYGGEAIAWSGRSKV